MLNKRSFKAKIKSLFKSKKKIKSKNNLNT